MGASRGSALCESHERTWITDGRPTAGAFQAWCIRARALDVGSQVVMLGGLTERARLEVLYGLKRAAELERPTGVKALQAAANRLRAEQAANVSEATLDGLPRDARSFLVFTAASVELASTSPEAEMAKDRWDLRVFGRSGGWVHFGHLSQRWLKTGAKAWVAERFDTVESPPVSTRSCLSWGRCRSRYAAIEMTAAPRPAGSAGPTCWRCRMIWPIKKRPDGCRVSCGGGSCSMSTSSSGRPGPSA
ncbi:MAG: hypothetical protein M3083_11125 [Actinomycetota bacterium]|nr:hypothetical protein [Actinomycetota bacterium]